MGTYLPLEALDSLVADDAVLVLTVAVLDMVFLEVSSRRSEDAIVHDPELSKEV